MEELSNFILVDDIIKDDNWNVTIIFIAVCRLLSPKMEEITAKDAWWQSLKSMSKH